MNRKGFTLVELLGSLALLGMILCIGLYVTRGTLATSLSTLTDVSENEIYDAAKIYVLEKGITWTNVNEEEYTCLTVRNLIEKGYFELGEVVTYKDNIIKIVREPGTKVFQSVKFVNECN